MKKFMLTTLGVFISFGIFAQTNQEKLIENTWYLTKIEVNNQISLPPFEESSESSVLQHTQEDGEISFTHNQCVNSGFGNYSVLSETMLHISSFIVTSSICPNNDLDQFFSVLNNDVIWNNIDDDFQYFITTENNILQLQIVGANGNKVFYNTDASAGSKSFNGELLKIYPNPTSDFLNVSISDLDRVEIFDMLGKRYVPIYNTSTNGTQIDIQNLSKGNYILQVSKQNQTETIKFIKN